MTLENLFLWSVRWAASVGILGYLLGCMTPFAAWAPTTLLGIPFSPYGPSRIASVSSLSSQQLPSKLPTAHDLECAATVKLIGVRRGGQGGRNLPFAQ